MDAMTVKGKEFGVIESFEDATGEAIDAMAECISEIIKDNAQIKTETVKSAEAGDAEAVFKVIDVSINSSMIRGDVKYKMMAAITTSEDMDYSARFKYFKSNASLKAVKQARTFFLKEILPHAAEM